jgi:hypothetical protein
MSPSLIVGVLLTLVLVEAEIDASHGHLLALRLEHVRTNVRPLAAALIVAVSPATAPELL